MTKKIAKKKASSKKQKKAASRKQTHEVVLRVEQTALVPAPTVSDIAEPIRDDGKKLAIAKTWISENQIVRMVQATPKEFVYKRKGKGGDVWEYVTGNYIEKVLNYTFGWLWDFEIVEHGREGDFIWVHGRLTVKDAKGNAITKSQFGRSEVKYKKDSKVMLDFGNDLKAAATDSLKKCASLFGIASDIYGKTEYAQETGREVREDTSKKQPIKTTVTPVAQVDLKPGQVMGPDGKPAYVCSSCDEMVPEVVANYSQRIYKKVLCKNCQK